MWGEGEAFSARGDTGAMGVGSPVSPTSYRSPRLNTGWAHIADNMNILLIRNLSILGLRQGCYAVCRA